MISLVKDSTKIIDLINKVNADLALQFPAKHIPIRLSDVERTFKRNLLGFSVDAKTKKGLGKGYLTGILYLAPASLSGVNVCPKSSAGCRAACLYTAGRGRFYSVTRARIIKTLAYHMDPVRFVAGIKSSIVKLQRKADRMGLIPVVRLNGTSDILWERNTDIMQEFKGVQFYDYTKIAKRFLWAIPNNYHLTFSLSESNDADAALALSKGASVAAVFRDTIPTHLELSGESYEVMNGDETDLRFLDKRGVVIGLKAKGKAKKDDTGFVRDPVSVKIAA